MRDWLLAVDFGTTATAAAIRDLDTGAVELVDFAGSARLPSAVASLADGALVAGVAAERQALTNPERVERTPKRRLGDRALLLGDDVVSPVALVATVLREAASEATRRRGGEGPAALCLTHPAEWGSARLEALAEAAASAGLPTASFVPEPIAAAVQLAGDAVDVGAQVLVYDFGGGTFDTALLQRLPDGFAVIGRPGGDDRLGGETLDERLREQVGRRAPAVWERLRFPADRGWRIAATSFWTEVRGAKERLSFEAETSVYVPAPADLELALTRSEVEQAIRADVVATVDEAVATVERAGSSVAEVAAVHLVGGSSRIPLITRLLAERFGFLPTTWGDPKAVVVLGAAAGWRADLPAFGRRPRLSLVTPGARLEVAGVGGLIGRADPPRGYLPDVDLTELDPARSVSRRHAQITLGSDGVELLDMGSANGTWVDDRRLEPGRSTALRHGQRLRLGDVELGVELSSGDGVQGDG